MDEKIITTEEITELLPLINAEVFKGRAIPIPAPSYTIHYTPREDGLHNLKIDPKHHTVAPIPWFSLKYDKLPHEFIEKNVDRISYLVQNPIPDYKIPWYYDFYIVRFVFPKKIIVSKLGFIYHRLERRFVTFCKQTVDNPPNPNKPIDPHNNPKKQWAMFTTSDTKFLDNEIKFLQDILDTYAKAIVSAGNKLLPDHTQFEQKMELRDKQLSLLSKKIKDKESSDEKILNRVNEIPNLLKRMNQTEHRWTQTLNKEIGNTVREVHQWIGTIEKNTVDLEKLEAGIKTEIEQLTTKMQENSEKRKAKFDSIDQRLQQLKQTFVSRDREALVKQTHKKETQQRQREKNEIWQRRLASLQSAIEHHKQKQTLSLEKEQDQLKKWKDKYAELKKKYKEKKKEVKKKHHDQAMITKLPSSSSVKPTFHLDQKGQFQMFSKKI